MKRIVTVIVFLAIANCATAQTELRTDTQGFTAKASVHRIVFQLTSEDTFVHKSLMKQLNNIKTVAPDAMIEVVCHGPGLSILVAAKSTVQEKIKQMKAKGIEFFACEFSMSERNVTKDKMIPEAGFVRAGIIEIVTKQEAGWSYIKLGF